MGGRALSGLHRALRAAVLGAPAEHGAAMPRSETWALGAIVALALALRLAVLLTSGWTEPAALMTLRVSENIAHGDGFVYNLGERVLATTTPLYALLLALFSAIGLPALEMGKATGILADLALCAVVHAWLRGAGHPRAGLVAAFLVAVDTRLAHWSISGMETSLVTLLGMRAWLALAQRRYRTAAVVLAVLFLVRWDTALLGAVLAAAVVLRERRLLLGPAALAVAVVAPWLVFATWYFGSPIPPTFMAKVVVQGRVTSSFATRIDEFRGVVLGTRYQWMLAAAALSGLAVAVLRRARSLWPAVAWLAAYFCACLLSGAPIFARYVVPALPVQLALAALGLVAAFDRVVAKGPPVLARALPAGAAAAALLVFLPLIPRLHESQAFHDGVDERAGLWVREHSEPGDRLMITPRLSPGYFGYYSGLPVIDAKGLLTPVVLPFWGPGHASPIVDIARALRPEWIVMDMDELPSVRSGAPPGEAWDDDWKVVESFFSLRNERAFVVCHRRKGPLHSSKMRLQ